MPIISKKKTEPRDLEKNLQEDDIWELGTTLTAKDSNRKIVAESVDARDDAS